MINPHWLALIIAVLPESLLIAMACICAGLGVFRRNIDVRTYRGLSVIGFCGAIVAAGIGGYGMRLSPAHALIDFGGELLYDRFAVLCTIVIAIVGLMSCIASETVVQRVGSRVSAYYALVLSASAAAMFLVSERGMVATFVGVQLLVLCITLLLALPKAERTAGARALHYAVRAGIATATMAYGLVVLYGVTGSTDFASVPDAYAHSPQLTFVGIVLTLLGLSFFVGLVPWQGWIRSMSEDTPAPMVGTVVALSFIAGNGVVIRMCVSGFGSSISIWGTLLSVLICFTLIEGAVTVIAQRRLQGIVLRTASMQSALALIGVVAFGLGHDYVSARGINATLYMVITMAMGMIAMWLLIDSFARSSDGARQTSAHLLQQAPATGVVLMMTCSGLGAIPPLATFVGLILVVSAAFSVGYAWLGIVALFVSSVLCIAYIRYIVSILDGSADVQLRHIPTRAMRMVTTICACCVIAVVIVAGPLLSIIDSSVASLSIH